MAKIEFVEYTGHYPNLCSGRLFVKIDGKLVSFGNYCLGKKGKTKDKGVPNYPSFWETGGMVTFDENWSEEVGEGPWELISHNDFPEEMKEWLPELMRIFNEHVPWGCCGGCV